MQNKLTLKLSKEVLLKLVKLNGVSDSKLKLYIIHTNCLVDLKSLLVH